MTYKLAEAFFSAGYVEVGTISEFFKSDLNEYFNLLYRQSLSVSNCGIIKVIKKNNKLILSEFIYYDYFPDDNAEFFLNYEFLNLKSCRIENTAVGKKLSKNGYAILDITDKDLPIKKYPSLSFKPFSNENPLDEAYESFRFSEKIWDTCDENDTTQKEKQIREQLRKSLIEIVSFSDFLAGLDSFGVNFLKWKRGHYMNPHNGVDYRSFINLLTYNTEKCSQSRRIFLGEFDWYAPTFFCIKNNNFDPLLNIGEKRKLIEGVMVNTQKAVVINSFNPRFYHEVEEFKGEGELFVSTANLSYKAITKSLDISW